MFATASMSLYFFVLSLSYHRRGKEAAGWRCTTYMYIWLAAFAVIWSVKK